jgi:hypothetical protein
MWSRKYVIPEICRPDDNMSAICRPETGENMLAQKIFLGGAAPEPQRGGLRPPAPPEGGPSGPPSYPPACLAQALDTTTRAKNITHTQHSPTCCFLCTQGVTGLHSQQSRAAMPMDPLHQENFSVLTDFVNESATFFKVSTFISDTLFSSIMSLTK